MTLLTDVEVLGTGLVDCRVRDGVVTELGPALPPHDDTVLAGYGGALLPGLADHHLHLAATAAHDASVDLTDVPPDSLGAAVAAGRPGPDGWVRVVGYDDVRHGDLDRTSLDTWSATTPVRVQHRSGALWVLSTAGLDRVGAMTAGHPGIERDEAGEPTGRLWRADDWLGDALGASPAPSLAALGARLAGYGITHVTDATPTDAHLPLVLDAVRRGDLPQHVLLLAAGAAAATAAHPRISVGPVKIVVGDHALPALDDLVARVEQAHAAGRAVAVHCVTPAALALTVAATDAAGHRDGDRIEHCAVADPGLVAAIAERGLRVVTQPTLVTRRGDDYWDRSEPAERAHLWPYASLLAAGVRTAPSSDAPYGDPDPWAGLAAAGSRTTRSGRVLGADERVPAATALQALLSHPEDPGGPARTVAVGAPADLVLLDRPLAEALRAPSSEHVRATLVQGRAVFGS